MILKLNQYILIVVIVLLEFYIGIGKTRQNQDYCSIKINGENLPKLQPLFLDNKHKFLYPSKKNPGAIIIKKGAEIVLACPGRKNYLQIADNKNHQSVYHLKCNGLNSFKYEESNSNYELKQLRCHKRPKSSAKIVGKCIKNKQQIIIGFKISENEFLDLITVCFDAESMRTLYGYFKMHFSVGKKQHVSARPAFKQGGFYRANGINNWYKKKTQHETLQWAYKIIQEKSENDDYLARGHLVAMTDFPFDYQQLATFYFINTLPQWQGFNNGNWRAIEYSIQKFVAKKGKEMEIYVGGYGNMTVDGKIMYLIHDESFNALPVPKYYWKVVYDPSIQAAVAFVGVNDPFFADDKDIFCMNICKNIDWIDLDGMDVEKGLLFCCDINEFRKTIQYLPKFPVIQLLSYWL